MKKIVAFLLLVSSAQAENISADTLNVCQNVIAQISVPMADPAAREKVALLDKALKELTEAIKAAKVLESAASVKK